MFPIYILEKGVKLPKNGTYYVITAKGIFLHKENDLIKALVRVEQISFLENARPWARHHFPKIPTELIVQAINFFKKVYQEFGTEAVLLLHYAKKEKRFRLSCPEQKTVELGVDFKKDFRFPGFQLVGTIHSHSWLEAFHSQIDDKDNGGLDGLHITFGDLDTPYFSASCSLMVNAGRFMIKPEDLLEGVEKVEWKRTLNRNEEDELQRVPICFGEPLAEAINGREIIFEAQSFFSEEKFKDKTQYYRLSDGEMIEFPAEWLEMVTVKRESKKSFVPRIKDSGGQAVRLVSLQEKKGESNGITEHQGDRSRRHRLLSFAMFGKIFTISVGPRHADDAH